MVVGGGPAGMVAGLLLARAGVEVTVLEKHPDFLRDFRGDTVHPSTLTRAMRKVVCAVQGWCEECWWGLAYAEIGSCWVGV